MPKVKVFTHDFFNEDEVKPDLDGSDQKKENERKEFDEEDERVVEKPMVQHIVKSETFESSPEP